MKKCDHEYIKIRGDNDGGCNIVGKYCKYCKHIEITDIEFGGRKHEEIIHAILSGLYMNAYMAGGRGEKCLPEIVDITLDKIYEVLLPNNEK